MKKVLSVWLAALLMLCCVMPCAIAADNDFQFAQSKVSLFEGETVDLDLLAQGDCAGADVTYKSANMKVATVSTTGTLTAIGKGTTRITATCTVGKKKHTATVNVTVKRAATSVSVTNEQDLNLFAADDPILVDLADNEDCLPVIMMVPGNKMTIRATALPKDASSTKTFLSSDDEEVLTVSNMIVTAVAPGNAVLTVASESNPDVFQQYLVLVSQPVTGIVISGDSTVFVGDTVQLYANAVPEAATIQDVTWTSGNASCASVDAYGVVTALKKGTSVITATAIDGSGVKATHKITVSTRPTAVTLNTSSGILKVGGKVTLRATVTPNTVSDKTVVWQSSDPSVATVSKGTVTGLSVGTATITASSSIASDIYAEYQVQVVQPVTGVSSLTGKLQVLVNDTVDTSWSVQPSTASIQTLSYKSSNARVATVDADGTVHGIKAGTVTITATSTDGTNRSGRVTVEVIQPVEGVHMKQDNWNVGLNERTTVTAVLEPTDASNKNMTWSVADAYIAKITGTTNRPTVTGLAWGDTVIYGVTEDGGYTTSASLHVGDYNKALTITDLYLSGNAIKMAVRNESNMTISRFNFEVDVYDINDEPIICNNEGTNTLFGYYNYNLEQGASTVHGRFTFYDFIQPSVEIGRIVMRITSYSTTTGFSHTIRSEYQIPLEYTSPDWATPTPEPTVEPTPEPTEEPVPTNGLLDPV